MQIFLKEFLPANTDRNIVSATFHSTSAKKGSLSCLITIKSKSDLDAANVARFIWNGVLDEFNYFEGDILESIKSAIAVADDKLLQLIKNDKESENSGVELDLALVAFHEGTLSFGIYEQQNIHVLHENELTNITEILNQNGVKAGSSNIGVNDIVILSTEKTLDPLSANQENQLGVDTFLSSIALLNEGLKDGDGLLLISPNDSILNFEDSGELIEETEELNEETEVVNEEREEVIEQASAETDASPLVNEEETAEPIFQDQNLDRTTQQKASDAFEKAKVQGAKTLGVIKEKLQPIKEKGLELKKQIDAKRKSKSEAQLSSSTVIGADQLKQRPAGANPLAPVINFLSNKYGRNPKFKRFMAKFTQSRISSPSMKGMKIGGYRDSSLRNKRFGTLGVVVVLVLIAILAIKGVRNYQEERAISEQFATTETKVKEFINEGEIKIKSDSNAAELALFNAEKTLGEANLTFDALNEDDQAKYKALESSLQGLTDKINKTVALTEDAGNIELFLDGRIEFGQNANTGDIAMFQNTFLEEHLYITDRGRKTVYRISTQSGESTPLPGSENLEAPVYIDIGVEGVYIYDLAQGVIKSPFGENNAKFEPMNKINGLSADAFNQSEIDDLAIFTEIDNVYAISSEAAALYKASRTEAGTYALPSVYIADPALSQAKDIFGDFSIYVLTGGSSGLNRYTYSFSEAKLLPDPVAITGLRDQFQNLTAGFTGPYLDKKLYVFDNDLKRIIVFEKPDNGLGIHPGEMLFIKQYEYRGDKEGVFGDVKDIVVDNAEQFMYVLDGNTVWRITL